MKNLTVKEIVDNNLYFCHPFKSNFLHTPRWDVITAYIKNFDFKVGCELGVSTGENFFYLLEKNEDLFLYGVDTWKAQEDNELEDYSQDMPLDVRKELVFDELKKYPTRTKIYQERTDEAHKHFADESIDFIFIDADHTYESVKKDIELWTPKVKHEGIILGHDINWGDVAWAVGEYFSNFTVNGDNVWASTRYWKRGEYKKISKPAGYWIWDQPE